MGNTTAPNGNRRLLVLTAVFVVSVLVIGVAIVGTVSAQQSAGAGGGGIGVNEINGTQVQPTTHQFSFEEGKICTDVTSNDRRDCLNEKSVFDLGEDDDVIAWFRLRNVYHPMDVRFKWYDPSGDLHETEYITVEDPEEEGYDRWDTYTLWPSRDPSFLGETGSWQVEFQYENSLDNWETLDTQTFTLMDGENDRFEPNDDRSEATSISPGFYSDLYIVDGESDYFEISLDQGDEITATIQFDDTESDIDLEIQDSDGTDLEGSYSTSDDETVTYEVEESGTYYIHAYEFSGGGAPYSLDVSVDGGNDRFEPNDDFSSAAQVGAGSYSDLQINDGESDYFAVDLDNGDELTASIQFSDDTGDIDLAVHNPDRNEMEDSTSTSDDEEVSVEAQQSGTYYIEVYGFGGASAPYSLDVDIDGGNDRFEPNDDRSEATSISPGFYSDLYIVDGESDYFEISLDQGDEITATIQFDDTESDIDLEIQDSDGTDLEGSYSTSDDETVTYEVEESGTYYIHAYEFSGGGAPYSLDISVDGGSTSPDASFTYSPSSPDTSDSITFDASGSSDSDGSIQRYDWDFGDGSTATATGETVTHTYSSAGTYTVELTVTDDEGATDTTTQTVSVENVGTESVSIDSPDTTQPDGNFDFTVEMMDSGVGEVAVESSDFDVDISVVDTDGDSIGTQTDTSVEFIDLDGGDSTYTLNVDVTGGSEGDMGTITAATGGNIDGSGVDDQTSTTFSLADVPPSPIEGLPDELWTVVTQNDGEAGLSLADLGNAISEYQGDGEINDVDISLSDLGSLIQYYQNEVA